MSTKPRIDSAVLGQEPNLGNVLAQVPNLAQRFGDFYSELWQNGTVDTAIREVTRIRVARITDCGY